MNPADADRVFGLSGSEPTQKYWGQDEDNTPPPKTIETRTLRLLVAPEGEPIFCEEATMVEIDDEAAGEFIKITQDDKEISLNPEEWPAIRDAIDYMVGQCKK